MSPSAQPELVHSRLVRWAAERSDWPALTDGQTTLTFAQLHEAVRDASRALGQAQAPAHVLVEHQRSSLLRVVDFLAIIASGRCAAVSDPDWTDRTRDAVRASIDPTPANPPAPGPTTPFYIGFTSGSTGVPKGFRRHHRSWVESFHICADTFGPDVLSRILIPGRLSHSLFLFGIMLGLWSGAGVVLQERFSASQLLDSLAQGEAACVVAVPSQLLVLLELAARRPCKPIEGVRLVLISGARWMREHTPALQALFPRARLIEFYGASETSFIAWMPADPEVPFEVVGRPFANVELDIRQPCPSDGTGLIYVRSPMVFMDYVGGSHDDTAALRDADWLSVRDMGRLDAQGRLHLVGRQHRMIVTQGKNLFPEELERVLSMHPAVTAASVHGLAHPVRGQVVAAIVQLHPGASLTAGELSRWCRTRLESYKCPRHVFVTESWPLTASGKSDHPALEQALRHFDQGVLPAWLHPLR